LYGNWKSTTFIAALRHDRVTAPFVLEGAMNGETFRAYVEQILAPTLKRGDIAFMDNVPIHKVAGVPEAIEARGAILIYPHTVPTSTDRTGVRQAQSCLAQDRRLHPHGGCLLNQASLQQHRRLP
jgi:hypothetical protein